MVAWRLGLKGPLLTLVVGIAALMLLPAGATLGAASVSESLSVAHGGSGIGAAASPAVPAGVTQAALSPLSQPSAASLLSQIPARLEKAPWIASLTHTGPTLGTLTSVPNLGLLEHPVTPGPTGTINPFYVAQPAPLGLGDFGLGATPYSYNTSHIMGEATFETPPNVTDPGSMGVIEVSGQHLGNVGSMYEFGIQLNTVATNVTMPGSDQGFFWTQNVVNFNDTGIHFVDDTFNMSGDPVIEPGTIYSACNNNSAGVQQILNVYGGVFQCVGGTIPITPASYPVTLQLYNNATVDHLNQTIVSYGYRFTFHGTGQVFTGIASQVVFNNPNPYAPLGDRPGFSIDGFAGAPGGVFRDAEFVLVGDIGGDNSVFRAMDGTLNLEYSNTSSGGWKSVPSAYNFGTDTGETSTGIADYWTPSHTLVIHQGPAMLYGLWNSVPSVAVPSGSIHIEGSISPSYGFVFVSNTPPALDPWNATLGERSNMSWLPTTDAGTFNTYLPPPGGAWTARYYVEGLADGYATGHGTPITGSVSGYVLTLKSAPGRLDAPLYAFSNAQASALALAVTGSAAPPYTFSNLTVNMNLTFEHVNDYGYPEFVVFMSQDVTNAIHVSNVFQGQDSPAGNFVIIDYSVTGFESGLIAPAPYTFLAFDYTSGINIFGGGHDQVSDQITAEDGYNLQVVLWGDHDAKVWNIESTYGSYGVFIGDSTDTHVWNVSASDEANGLTDMGSTGTVGWDISATGDYAFAVYALSSHDATFYNIAATNGAEGLVTGAFDNSASGALPYYWLPGSTGLTIRDFVAINGSLAANISLSEDVSVSHVTANFLSLGVVLARTNHATISAVDAVNESEAVTLLDSHTVDINRVIVFAYSVGVVAVRSTGLTITHVVDGNHSNGIDLVDSSGVSVDHVLAEYRSVGVILYDSSNVTLNNIRAIHHSIAIEIE
jgi:thermopsin